MPTSVRHFFILLIAVACAAVGLDAQPAHATHTRLVKTTDSPAVYFQDHDKRYVFPNAATYFTWYDDFSTVKIISNDEMASLQVAGNITYRPGTRLIKLTNDPKVYAVEPGGMLRWVKTEQVARDLYGPDWAQRIDDLSDGFFPAYTIGAPIEQARHPEGTLFYDPTLAQHYLLWNGQRRKVTALGMECNRFQPDFAIETDTSHLFDDSTIDTYQSFSDPAQVGLGVRQANAVEAHASGMRDKIFIDTDGEVVARFVLSFTEETELRALPFRITAITHHDKDEDPGGLVRGDGETNIEPNLQNFTLMDEDENQLTNTAHLSTFLDEYDEVQEITLSGRHTFAPGRHVLTLRADIPADTPADQLYTATVLLKDAEFLVNGGRTDSLDPPMLTFDRVRTRQPALRVNCVRGTSELFIGGQVQTHDYLNFCLQNALREPVVVERIALTGHIDENEGHPDFQPGRDTDNGGSTAVSDVVDRIDLVDLDTGDVIESQTTIGADGTIEYAGLNWRMEAGEERSFTIRLHINQEAPFGIGNDRIGVNIVSATDIDVRNPRTNEDVDVNNLPINGSAARPGVVLTLAHHGTLKIESSGGGGRLLMDTQRRDAYNLRFTASEEEDIRIEQLAVRLLDTTAERSIEKVEVRYLDENRRAQFVQSGISASGAITFSDLNIIIPKQDTTDNDDEFASVSIAVSVRSHANGGRSGDKIGFVFEPGTFAAEGVISGERLTSEDIGGDLTDETSAGGEATVRKTQPVVQKSDEQPFVDNDPDTDTSTIRFTLRGVGDPPVHVTKMTFKIEPSDVGYEDEFGNTSDNDLLEFLADLNGDNRDANDVSDLVEITNGDGDPLAEGNNGHINFYIYDDSEGEIDTTPQGLDTGPRDYGILEYEFTDPLLGADTIREFELRLDTRGVAEHRTTTIDVSSEGGNGFVWNDGTISAPDLTGGGVIRPRRIVIEN